MTLSIGGREYKVACAAGEEAHVSNLGRLIDGKLASMEGMTGQSEARTLLFAALLLADELHETKAARSESAAQAMDLVPLLEQFAARMENLATRLESEEASA